MVLIREAGIYLFSQAVSSQLSSAQVSLTSVFGMGTGVPSPQSTPTIYLSSGFCPRTFIIIPPLDSLVKRFFGDPSGIRTHVNGVRGRCLNRLTTGPHGELPYQSSANAVIAMVRPHGLEPGTH